MILKIWETLKPWACLLLFIVAEILNAVERLGLVTLYIVTEICDTMKDLCRKEEDFNVGNSECESES